MQACLTDTRLPVMPHLPAWGDLDDNEVLVVVIKLRDQWEAERLGRLH